MELPPPHGFVPYILNFARTNTDFIAAAVILMLAWLVLYSRRNAKAPSVPFDLPFLF
jgi:hypothetical protein